MKKILLIFVLIVLAACKPATPDPAAIQTAIAQTQAAQPAPTATVTNTLIPTPSPVPTSTLEPEPVVYYYFVMITGSPLPAGSVVILPDELILAPMITNKNLTSDTAANLKIALLAMIHDPDNTWTSSNLEITGLTFIDGAVKLVLQGQIFAPGDIVLIATKMQFLMTVFAEPSVQTATITINGKNIANLGISRESDLSPDDYAYSRDEVESYIEQHSAKTP